MRSICPLEASIPERGRLPLDIMALIISRLLEDSALTMITILIGRISMELLAARHAVL